VLACTGPPLYDLLKQAKYETRHDRPPKLFLLFFFPFRSSTIVNCSSNLCLCRCPCKLIPRSLAQLISDKTSVTRPQPAPSTVSDVPTLFLAASEQEAQRLLFNRNVNVQRSCLPSRSGESSFTTSLQRSTFLSSKSLSDLARLVAAADPVPLENAFLCPLDESPSTTLSLPGTARALLTPSQTILLIPILTYHPTFRLKRRVCSAFRFRISASPSTRL
jgi:hypothetical protein